MNRFGMWTELSTLFAAALGFNDNEIMNWFSRVFFTCYISPWQVNLYRIFLLLGGFFILYREYIAIRKEGMSR